MISTNDLRTGVAIELDGEVYTVVEFMHVKPGKGSAFVRTKLKNAKTGSVLERTFNAGEKLPRAHLEKREMQFLYRSDDQYTLMDLETYEQLTVPQVQMGNAVNFLVENMNVNVLLFQGSLFGVEVQNSVELSVVETDPGLKGDTAAGGSKPAKLETGYVVKVPLFINPGDRIIVDTRSGNYLSRA